ncbi:MAG TPA: substrate-binding domain-containing protein [Clostridiaceae bacterium]|nr:substrate-binding domain-containing protein [Clostridiaceae bacterium]
MTRQTKSHSNQRSYQIVIIIILLAAAVVSTSFLLINLLKPYGKSNVWLSEKGDFVVGLIRTPAEDDGRTKQYDALINAIDQSDCEKMVMNAERTQASQIENMRALIAYRVDVIVFTPLVETGWSRVLREAADAQVEVIAVANAIKYKSEDPHCHTLTFDYFGGMQTCLEDINGAFQDEQIMLELVGSVNAYSSRELSRGIRQRENGEIKVPEYSYSADNLTSYAEEITLGVLAAHPQVNLIFAQNEGMLLGAYAAVQEMPQHSQVCKLYGLGSSQRIYDLYETGAIDCLLWADNEILSEVLTDLLIDLKQHIETEPRIVEIPLQILADKERE